MNSREWIDGIFREHADALFRYLRSFRLPEDDVYDLVQSVFLKLIDVPPGSLREPRAWLFTVGRNLALNSLAQRSRFVDNPDAADPPDTTSGPLDALLSDEESRLLWDLFGQLPREEQDVFRLHLEHGLSYAEIGAIFGKSAGAVKVAVHRAREWLRKERGRLAVSFSGEGEPDAEQKRGD